jgi:hypothetical protein
MCAYCRYGSSLGEDEIVCKKHGIVSAFGSCGAFRYEPTKRMPEVSPVFDASRFTEDDFVV